MCRLYLHHAHTPNHCRHAWAQTGFRWPDCEIWVTWELVFLEMHYFPCIMDIAYEIVIGNNLPDRPGYPLHRHSHNIDVPRLASKTGLTGFVLAPRMGNASLRLT